MLDKLQKRKDSGFTIVEVMIVLAIAGLIILIVFLAVPALQRNSRNTQRSSDAARTVGAVNECMANNNGNLTLCTTAAQLDPAYMVFANNSQLTALGTAGINGVAITTNSKCNGNAVVAGGGVRAFVVTFMSETSNGTTLRCVSG
jgi:prepilin-type N-terminal cleavage/methylation domain-containing protein